MCVNVTHDSHVLKMEQSESSHDEEDEGPTRAKRGKPEVVQNGLLRPVKLSRGDLYKPPTADELNQLKEAESLFHCSLLKMQVRRGLGMGGGRWFIHKLIVFKNIDIVCLYTHAYIPVFLMKGGPHGHLAT